MNEKTTLPLARLRVLFMLPIIFIIIAVASGCNSKNSNNQLPENNTAIEQVEPVAATVEEPIITDTLEYLFNYSNNYKEIMTQEYFKKNMDKILVVNINRNNEILARGRATDITNFKSTIHELYPNGTDSIIATLSFDRSASKKIVLEVLNILESELKEEKNNTQDSLLPPTPRIIIPAPIIYTKEK